MVGSPIPTTRKGPACRTTREAQTKATALRMKRNLESPDEVAPPAKSQKSNGLSSSSSARFQKGGTVSGSLYCVGMNYGCQLGIDLDECPTGIKYPTLVQGLRGQKIKAIACGGMHTIALDETGQVWTFGDEEGLGQRGNGQDIHIPGLVNLPNRVICISAGDTHSAAVTEDGEVYAWGSFNTEENVRFGLLPGDGPASRQLPERIGVDILPPIIKVASGATHIVMLSETGEVYTIGYGSKGQLGRPFIENRPVTRSMSTPPTIKDWFLKPAQILLGRTIKIKDIFAGGYSTFCLSRKDEIYVMGLNNYEQLGIAKKRIGEEWANEFISKPTKKTAFKGRKWKDIAIGQHHAVALDGEGNVYTIGRSSYGQLGIGDIVNDRDAICKPTKVEGLRSNQIVHVAAGDSTSYAITVEGHLYAWGFGDNYQLSNGSKKLKSVPIRCLEEEGKEIGRVIRVDAGASHVAITISQQV